MSLTDGMGLRFNTGGWMVDSGYISSVQSVQCIQAVATSKTVESHLPLKPLGAFAVLEA